MLSYESEWGQTCSAQTRKENLTLLPMLVFNLFLPTFDLICDVCIILRDQASLAIVLSTKHKLRFLGQPFASDQISDLILPCFYSQMAILNEGISTRLPLGFKLLLLPVLDKNDLADLQKVCSLRPLSKMFVQTLCLLQNVDLSGISPILCSLLVVNVTKTYVA